MLGSAASIDARTRSAFRREDPDLESVACRVHVHLELLARGEIADQDLLRERILDVALNRAPQRPGTELLVVTLVDEEVERILREGHVQPLLGQARVHVLHQDVHEDRKSTRLNSSHVKISYSVICLK